MGKRRAARVRGGKKKNKDRDADLGRVHLRCRDDNEMSLSTTYTKTAPTALW